MELKTKIEQAVKDVVNYKTLYEEKLKSAQEKTENFAKVAETLDDEQIYEKYFQEKGAVIPLQIDFNQALTRLYYYLDIADEVVEIPPQVKQLVEDYKIRYTFTSKGEVADKELYNHYKKLYKAQIEVIKNQLENSPSD